MTARDFALYRLDSLTLPLWPSAALPRTFAGKSKAAPADARDIALAEQIEIGVIKNLLLLQHLIEHYSRRPLRKLDPVLQKILAVALYQLRFLSRIPASAAVSEAVEQCRRARLPHATGLVNACLRAALREPEVPLPQREQEPARYAEVCLSHPRELFERLQKLVGDDRALAICEHDNAEPPVLLRLSPGVEAAALAEEGVQVEAHAAPGIVVVRGARRKQLAAWAAAGLAQAQDATAAAVVPSLPVKAGMTVMDRCCGAGTKTLQLAGIVGTEGRVVAIDSSAQRCDVLRQSLADRRITCVQVYESQRIPPLSAERPASFDAALLDVPCSNSGVLARRADARYHQTAARLNSLRELQLEILEDTLPVVAVGGFLAYSTCSIWPEENELLVQTLLQQHPNWTKVTEQSTLPSCDGNPARYHDGGYLCLLRKDAQETGTRA